ncbi:MAG: NAD(P)-binding protein [Rhizobiales bacterium]|nr:NAD(P)-binding protein [Hyphomicrobiales bacterium]
MQKKTVGIIGAGISGLATAKAFASQGHAVTVVEKLATLGGVWSPERRYPGLSIQISRRCYSFSDFPMPESYPEFPSSEQMNAYLEAYADRFGMRERIRFGTEVREIVRRPDGRDGWRLNVRNVATDEPASLDFDFVVVCNGLFSIASIPTVPGRDEFEAAGGVVLHSSQLRDVATLKDRTAVVVGFGKSAIDMTEVARANARSATMLCRNVHWKFPRRMFGRVNVMRLVLSRFTEVWFPNPEGTRTNRFLHRWLRPLVDAYWWLSERAVGGQLGLRGKLRPDISLRQASVCIGLAPADGFKALREGEIGLVRGSIARLRAKGIELASGDVVPADAVIFATGYAQDCAFLGATEKAALFDPAGAVRLYRSLVNPDLPFMGFNGYNGVGACQITAEVGACWLVRFMEGRVQVPDRAAMLASIRDELDLRARLVTSRLTGGTYVSPFTFGYLDRLLRDLGLPPADRNKPLFKRLFDPIDPTDYRDVLNKADAH